MLKMICLTRNHLNQNLKIRALKRHQSMQTMKNLQTCQNRTSMTKKKLRSIWVTRVAERDPEAKEEDQERAARSMEVAKEEERDKEPSEIEIYTKNTLINSIAFLFI